MRKSRRIDVIRKAMAETWPTQRLAGRTVRIKMAQRTNYGGAVQSNEKKVVQLRPEEEERLSTCLDRDSHGLAVIMWIPFDPCPQWIWVMGSEIYARLTQRSVGLDRMPDMWKYRFHWSNSPDFRIGITIWSSKLRTWRQHHWVQFRKIQPADHDVKRNHDRKLRHRPISSCFAQ